MMQLFIIFLLLILIGIGSYLYFTLRSVPPVSGGGYSSLINELKAQNSELQEKLDRALAATTQAETLAEERKNHIAKLEGELLQIRKRLNDSLEEKLELSNELTRVKVKAEDEQTAKDMVAELRRKIDEKFDRT